ncbi:MAG: 6-phosphogluconolactonase [Ahrensia sp.]|nr:6-phosphogluconolactonase [Ahrensia sp.]
MRVSSVAAVERNLYGNSDLLAEAMASKISGLLAGAIAARGQAVLAVSGGSTPKKFFDAISHTDIDWSRVTILLVDERIVAPTHERANARLVRDNLLRNRAAKANLIPYVVDAGEPEDCASASGQFFSDAIAHIDALVLGMGTDGHTASFFPGGDNLASATKRNGKHTVLAMRASGAGEPRLTLTLPVILSAHYIAIHIEGDEKMGVFDEALSGDDEAAMPVRSVLHNASKPLNLFWAP